MALHPRGEDRDPEKLYGWEMDGDYLFAIQKVRPPKGKKCLGRRFSEFHAYLVPLFNPRQHPQISY